jgi:hypothetical protein
MTKHKRRPWTVDDDRQLSALYPTARSQDIADRMHRSTRAIYSRARELGLRKDPEAVAAMARANTSRPGHGSERTRFQKGQASTRAGVRGIFGYHPATKANWFRTGQLNGRALQLVQPVGSYRVTTEGYLEQKLSEEPGPSRRRWKQVHHILWEAANGPIPAGHVVVFKLGKPITVLEDITLDTLELVSRAELMRRNSFHTRYPKQVALLVQARAVLTRQINRRTKKESE